MFVECKSLMLLLVASACAAGQLESPPDFHAAYASGFPPDSTGDQPFICDYRKLAWAFGTGSWRERTKPMCQTHYAVSCVDESTNWRGRLPCVRSEEDPAGPRRPAHV